MKILITIGIVLLSIIALFFLIALFIKKEYKVEKEIVINKSNTEVFNYIKYLKNQEHYNVWVMAEPQMKKEYKGTDGTIGFVYAWEGDKAGKGEQEIKMLDDGKKLESEIRFKKPFEGIAVAYFVTDSIKPNQTKVTWGMKGTNKYPMNMMNLFTNSLLGKDLLKSLNNLKIKLEK